MPEAVFGLVGVVIGAIATGAIGWLQAERARAIAARAAKRLVAQELLVAASVMEMATVFENDEEVANDLRDSVARQMLRQDAWVKHQGVLAEQLNDGDWAAVTRAYVSVTYLLNSCEHDDESLSGDIRDIVQGDFIQAGYGAVVGERT